jgi:hypothetical protein
MPELARLSLSILRETRTRAAAVRLGSVETALVEALSRGVALLERGDLGGRAEAESWLEVVADRARFDLLRHRALVLTESYRELDREVDALASESRELHDPLWEWPQRVDGLKVALGRRQAVRPRPEPLPTIGLGGSGKDRRGRGERLLDGIEREAVALEVPADLLGRAAAIVTGHNWHQEWGDDALLVVMAHGLALLELERGRAPEVPDAPNEHSGIVASLRYRLFELRENTRILTIRRTALSIDNRGMRMRLEQLQQEAAALEPEVAVDGRPEPPERGGWLDRLLRRPLGG